ncbi:MAG: hypothetical protein WC707_06065 [Candidatus Babeliaceae bacterium]
MEKKTPHIKEVRPFKYNTHTSGLANSSQKGLDDGWTRATFIVKKELLEKVKDCAYWERMTVKTIVNDALDSFFKNKK